MTATREMMEAWRKTTIRLYKRIGIGTIVTGLFVVIALFIPTLWWVYFPVVTFFASSAVIDAIRLKILDRKIVLKWDYDMSPWAEI